MLNEDQTQFAVAMLSERLRDSYGDVDAGNGTPAADALAAAIAVDHRLAGKSADEFALLGDEQLHEAMVDLMVALEHQHHGFNLPFGTRVEGGRPGGVSIGGRHHVLDAGRPGLWPMEATRRDAHGPNFDLLRRLIAKGARRLACKKLGLPSPHFIVESDARDLLQFPPLAEAGGVTLQRWAAGTGAERFCAAMPDQVAAMAESVVRDMRALWRRRRDVARQAAIVRRAAETCAAAHPEAGLRLTKVCIDMEHQAEDERLCFYLEYDGPDEALRRGAVLDFVPGDRVEEGMVLRAPRGVAFRGEDIAKLRKAGASGWIDEVSAAIVEAAPEGSAATLARLATEYQTLVTIPTARDPLFATLYWRDGVIRAEISQGDRLDWDRDRMEVTDIAVPATILAALPGRRLDEVAMLIPLKRQAGDGEERLKAPLLPFKIDGARWKLDIEGVAFARLSVLDLASLRPDGRVRLDLGHTADEALLPGLAAAYAAITGPLDASLAAAAAPGPAALKEELILTTSRAEALKHVRVGARKAALQRQGDHRGSLPERVGWNLRRMGRSRPPFSAALLEKTLQVMGRRAFDIDFEP